METLKERTGGVKGLKKILVVLTGGTIGSTVEGGDVDVTERSPYKLLKLYQGKYGEGDEFEVINPFTALSENMGLGLWGLLCRTMWDILYEDYEGVILAHGSDTLSYTSALLGILLCHVPVPVVLVASNRPLGEEGSNGLDNFRSAVELIHTHLLKGVYTVYQDNKGQDNVYLSTRITEADSYLDQFGCFGGCVLGRMEDGKFLYHSAEVNPPLSKLGQERPKFAKSCPPFEKNILIIKPYPGLDYRSVDLSVRPAAVLHLLYHSATACTARGDGSVLDLMERCRLEGIPFYAASGKQPGGRAYVTGRAMMEKGAFLLSNISKEAAYAKLLLLYNMYKDEQEVDKRVEDVFFFENLP